jgi:hypothetical protein
MSTLELRIHSFPLLRRQSLMSDTDRLFQLRFGVGLAETVIDRFDVGVNLGIC